MLQANTKHHNLGISRAGNGTRLWLEGIRLNRNGFTLGTRCERIWSQGRLIIRAIGGIDADESFNALERDCRTTIAGTVDRPIVDITGKLVAACFPTGAVLVTWAHNQITIEGV